MWNYQSFFPGYAGGDKENMLILEYFRIGTSLMAYIHVNPGNGKIVTSNKIVYAEKQ